MRQKSKTNSVRIGKYKFQPTKYDESGNLYCKLVKLSRVEKCKLTLLYKFDTGTYDLIFVSKDWMIKRNHKKLLELFLKEYDWI